MTAPATRDHGLSRAKHGPDEHGQPGKGCRCETCLEACRVYDRHRDRMIAYGWWQPYVDATGTQRRLQALIRCGWSQQALSARLGKNRTVVNQILSRREVNRATVAEIRALYDELWDQAPPEETAPEKGAATKARRHAREQGWPLPMAWDEDAIDDPDAMPAEGWERRDGARRWGILAAEAGELIEFGLDNDRAADRLGVSRSTLTTTLARARKREKQDAAA